MGIWDSITDAFHSITGIPTADAKRNQEYAVRDQMEAYKKQTEITNKEMERVRGEQDTSKRMIQEKQIRSLRRSFRPAGFLDSNNSSGNPTNNTLG